MAALVLVAALVLTAQGGENLTGKCESARKQIETGSLLAYSNGLSKMMYQSKQKADLDSFLAAQDEMKRINSSGALDDAMMNDNERVATLAKKVVADRNAKVADVLRQYISQLESILKQSMKADRIDEAKLAKAVIDAAKLELAQLELKPPKEQSGTPDQSAPARTDRVSNNDSAPKLGRLLRYTFDLSATMKVSDSTGNGYDGAGHGIRWDQSGKIGRGAVLFPNAKAYISLNDNAIPPLDPQDNCSIAFWWKSDTVNECMTFLNKRSTDDEARGLFFMYYAPRSCYYIHLKGGHTADFGVPVQRGVWNHVVLVKEETTWRVYHNGREVPITASAGWPFRESATKNVPLTIGKDDCGDSFYFQGSLDDFLIYNKALSDEEVLQLYGSFSGPLDPPVKVKAAAYSAR